MKKLIIIITIILISGFVYSLNNIPKKEPCKPITTTIQDDFFKNELNNAILDGFGDLDSLYFLN